MRRFGMLMCVSALFFLGVRAARGLQVVTTTTDLAALTRAVAASDTQTVELLLSVGVDPAKPGRGGMLPVDHIATPDASVATRLRALLGA